MLHIASDSEVLSVGDLARFLNNPLGFRQGAMNNLE